MIRLGKSYFGRRERVNLGKAEVNELLIVFHGWKPRS